MRFSPWDYLLADADGAGADFVGDAGIDAERALSGVIGAMFAYPGVDPTSGQARLTFGYWQVEGGFDVLPVLVGVFALGTVMADAIKPRAHGQAVRYTSEGLLMRWRDWKAQWVNLLRSSLIGTWIGILPGIGANIGSVVAYTVAKNTSKHPGEFGKGCPDGIVASESANNATVGGALIPLIAMGIPGSVIDVFLLGAMLIHGIQPGPLLFKNNGDLVYAIIAACFLSTIAMFVLMTVSVPCCAGCSTFRAIMCFRSFSCSASSACSRRTAALPRSCSCWRSGGSDS